MKHDDFDAIVHTIRLGRRIYENIRNAMRYLIAVHVPIAGMSVAPLLFGWPIFLLPLHIVFLEFVVDPACSVAFEAEQTDEDVMQRPPRDSRQPLFDASMLAMSFALGVSVLIGVCAVYWWVTGAGRSDAEIRAVGFAAIVFGNIALMFANRSGNQTIFATMKNPNPALWWVVIAALAALALVLYVPALAGLFRFSAPNAGDLLLAAAAGLAGIVWFECYKLARGRRVLARA